jgi:subtilisin family serine protease
MRPCSSSLVAACLCVLSLVAPASAATDRYRSQQWGLDRVAAPEAWQQSKGQGVIVAIIDTGLQVSHPDLADNVWSNPGETPGNGVDDDADGIVDDVHGVNLLDHTGDVTDDGDHGTVVAGIIAARADNGIGGAGVAPQATILPIKACTEAVGCRSSAIGAGIRYAVAHGARIINASFGGDVDLADERAAVTFAEEHGATVVAAAGNESRDIDTAPSYPASLPSPAVLSVTGTIKAGGLHDQVNWGVKSVDLAAPGSMIVTTTVDGGYRMSSGTSVATPFVSGALALLAAARPDLPQAQLRQALLDSARRTPATDGKVAAGELDVGAAMHRLVPGGWGGPSASAHASATGAGPLNIRLHSPRRVRSGRRVMLRWSATSADRVARWRLRIDGAVRTFSASKHRMPVVFRHRGHVRWTITALDDNDTPIKTVGRSFRITRR